MSDIDESTSGWMWFLIGLLLALFIGGAIRGLLSPQKLNLFISKTIESERPPFQITYDSVELSLRNGIIPRFGLLIKNLKIAAINPCTTASDLVANELFLPVSVSEALGGRVFLRRVLARDVRLNLKKSDCPNPNRAETAESLIALLGKFFETRLPQELLNTRAHIEGIELENFLITQTTPENGLLDFSLLSFDVGSSTKAAVASGRVRVGHGLFETSLQPLLWIDISATAQQIRLKAKGLFREGLILAEAVLQLPSTETKWNIKVKHLPIKPVVEHFKKGLDITEAWGFCNLQGESRFGNILTSKILMSGCYMEGDAAQATMANTSITFFPQFHFEPFHVDFKNADVAWFKENKIYLSGIEVEAKGDFHGQMDIAEDHQEGKGSIDEIEVAFWQSNLRLTQTLKNTEWTYQRSPNDQEKLRLNHFSSNNTAWIGAVDFLKQKNLTEVHAEMSEINLDKRLIRSLSPIEADSFKVSMNGKMIDQKFLELNGDISIPKGKASLFSFENFESSVHFKDQHYYGSFKTGPVEVKDEIQHLEHLKLLSSKGQWDVFDQGMSWDNVKSVDFNGIQYASLGHSTENQVSGLLLKNESGKISRFDLLGSFPKDLHLSENPDLKQKQTAKLMQIFKE